MLMNIVPLTVRGHRRLYAVHFAAERAVGPRHGLRSAAALAHTFVIGMQTMEAGHVPIAGTTQAISTFVWLLALAYLYMEMTTEERALGVFIVPLLVALQFHPGPQPGRRAARADPARARGSACTSRRCCSPTPASRSRA